MNMSKYDSKHVFLERFDVNTLSCCCIRQSTCCMGIAGQVWTGPIAVLGIRSTEQLPAVFLAVCCTWARLDP